MIESSPTDAEAAVTQDTDQPGVAVGFEQFMREQRTALVNFLARRTATREDAEDAAQESLTKLMRYKNSQPSVWKPLLYRIARNVAIDLRRYVRARPAGANSVESSEYLNELPSEEATPDQCLQHEQELAQMREVIMSLSPRCREVFLLNRMQGMTFVAIAQHLQISPRAVEKHVAKALVALRQRVGKPGSHPL
jgi:RNA polymerase sigma factor (sigma-70 family)